MKYIKPSLVFCCFFAAPAVLANCESFRCSGVTNTFVQSLKTTEHDVFLTFPAGVNTALDCNLQQGHLARLDTRSANFSSMHSLLLTAIASNAPLIVEFSQTESVCQVSSVEIQVSE